MICMYLNASDVTVVQCLGLLLGVGFEPFGGLNVKFKGLCGLTERLLHTV